MIRQETHRYERYGEQTVAQAAQLISKLPNGWTLQSLEYTREYGGGMWVATVSGPREDVK